MCINSLKWLGFRPSQVQALELDSSSHDLLTTVDINRIDSILSYSTNKIHETYRQEMYLMKSMGYKVELEALYSQGITFAAEFFKNALQNKDYL